MEYIAVGQGIAESSVPREDIFLTTKIWISNYGYEGAKRSLMNRYGNCGQITLIYFCSISPMAIIMVPTEP